MLAFILASRTSRKFRLNLVVVVHLGEEWIMYGRCTARLKFSLPCICTEHGNEDVQAQVVDIGLSVF